MNVAEQIYAKVPEARERYVQEREREARSRNDEINEKVRSLSRRIIDDLPRLMAANQESDKPRKWIVINGREYQFWKTHSWRHFSEREREAILWRLIDLLNKNGFEAKHGIVRETRAAIKLIVWIPTEFAIYDCIKIRDPMISGFGKVKKISGGP